MTRTTPRRADRITRHLVALGAALAGPALALEIELPAAARETAAQVIEAGVYDLPIGGWQADTGIPVATLEGQVSRKAWRVPGMGLTTGQVLGPVRDRLLQAGYDVIFECTTRSCGGFDFRFATDVLRAPAMYVDLSDYRFLSAKGPDATTALSILVSRDGDAVFLQLIEVGPAGRSGVSARNTSAVPAPIVTGDIAERLETIGHVALTDLEFDSGSATLGAGSKASLDALVDYLQANPERRITFVGHTDATGSLDANIILSRRRAEAVRTYVVSAGVPASQVASDGVGYLAPRSSNLTAEGREANRRVEAILISTE